MRQAPAFQRTLEQLNALLGARKIPKCHRPFNLGNSADRTTQFRLLLANLVFVCSDWRIIIGMKHRNLASGRIGGGEPDLDWPRRRNRMPYRGAIHNLAHPGKPPPRTTLPCAARTCSAHLRETHFHLPVEHMNPFFFAPSYPSHMDIGCPSDDFLKICR